MVHYKINAAFSNCMRFEYRKFRCIQCLLIVVVYGPFILKKCAHLPLPSLICIGPISSNKPYIEEPPGPPCNQIISGVLFRGSS